MLRIGLPLGAATLLIALNASAPRYFVGTFLGEDSLGVFTVLCYLCFPATAVVSSLVQASTPQLAGGYRNGGHRGMEALLRRLVSASLVICLLQSSFILSAGPWLLEVVFGSTFVVSRPLLVWVVIATSAGALASIPATAISAQRHFRLSLAVCVVSTAIGIFACLATIPRWELFGAAAAMALSSVAHGTLAALVGGMGRAPAIIASRLTPTHSSA